LGESEGRPRQIVRVGEQLADWRAAIAHARALPEVDPAKLAIWGFSASGGHIFPVAAHDPRLAAAIAQTPNADGPAAARVAAAYTTPAALTRLAIRGVLDAGGGLIGRQPLLVPLTGKRGTVAMLSTPDALDGDRALNPDNRYPEWAQVIAARSALRLSCYRPGRHASRVRCPLLVIVCGQDRTALPEPAVRAAAAAPRGARVRLPGGHYEPFLAGHDQTARAQVSFLRRHLTARTARDE
jgi:hypothetical protein